MDVITCTHSKKKGVHEFCRIGSQRAKSWRERETRFFEAPAAMQVLKAFESLEELHSLKILEVLELVSAIIQLDAILCTLVGVF